MNCQECKHIIFEAGITELGSDELKGRLEEHFSRCGRCRQFYELYTAGMEQLAKGRRTKPDEQLYEKINEKLTSVRHKSVVRPQIIRLGATFSGAAAAILTGILIGNRLISPFNEPLTSPETEVTTPIAYAADELYQDDAFLLVLESYLSETEKVEE
ncbi:MAG: hypothetical protein PHX54_01970 [Lentimicrobiaceae bacterium]|nr:hypothetical protein [Lentimicrobiaceae bacterium]